MNETEIRRIVIDALDNIAPDAGAASVDPKVDVRAALDIDSMDFLNFVTAVHQMLKVDIPEADYPKLISIAGAVEYLAAKLHA
jgi:acyl carrier protein